SSTELAAPAGRGCSPRRLLPRRPGFIPAPKRVRLTARGPINPEEVVMPVIVVTRLRLKDPALLDEFFTAAVAAIEQAQKSDGNLGADALADAGNAWWSVSAWTGRPPMQAFVDTEPHSSISKRLDHFCDEATFV